MPQSLHEVPLPYAYSETFNEKGLALYSNHAARICSWLHPGKLKALQDAGVVPAAAPGLPDFIGNLDDPSYTVPAPWERRKDGDGRVSYFNRETEATLSRHPDLADMARRIGGREVAPFTPGDSSLPEEDEWCAKGEIPPWVLEETTVPPPGSGLEPEPYWVNYRTGYYNSSQSPLMIYGVRMRIAETENDPKGHVTVYFKNGRQEGSVVMRKADWPSYRELYFPKSRFSPKM